jgi:hypothetical protein
VAQVTLGGQGAVFDVADEFGSYVVGVAGVLA